MTCVRDVGIGVGGNLGSQRELVERIAKVASQIRKWKGVSHVRLSPFYATAPVGPVQDQPGFVNAVLLCKVAESIQARSFFVSLLELERAMGRTRDATEVRFGPRTIDLDLLWWGDQTLREQGPPELVIPHPRMADRAFVLGPLIDLIGPDQRIPGDELTLGERLALALAAGQRATRLALS